MKTTLAILGIFAAAVLAAGTYAVATVYAFDIDVQTNKNGQQTNQNAGQAAYVNQQNGGDAKGKYASGGDSKFSFNNAKIDQDISQKANACKLAYCHN